MPVDDITRVAEAITHGERILLITGAGLSADSGLPTYRGEGGLYNGLTPDGLPITKAVSRSMLKSDPALCWKYLAEITRACLDGKPNPAHFAIADLQAQKPHCWVVTQNVDGYHLAAGSPRDRLIEIHGELGPLYCQTCAAIDSELVEHLGRPLPPRCQACGGVLRPPSVLFEERLPDEALGRLYDETCKGFDVVISIGTSASFPYVREPFHRARYGGGFTAEINPIDTDLSQKVDAHLKGRASEVLPDILEHLARSKQ